MKPATPLPWKVDVNGSLGAMICTKELTLQLNSEWRDLFKEQDAAYIVHACNNYGRLVGALHNLTNMLQSGIVKDAESLLRELGEL